MQSGTHNKHFTIVRAAVCVVLYSKAPLQGALSTICFSPQIVVGSRPTFNQAQVYYNADRCNNTTVLVRSTMPRMRF
jgi:hypothetical protein